MNRLRFHFTIHVPSSHAIILARRNMDNIIRVQGLGWDMPNLIRCDTGARTYGADYYQNMVLWGLPAALAKQDLTGPCKPGGLVQKVVQAATAK